MGLLPCKQPPQWLAIAARVGAGVLVVSARAARDQMVDITPIHSLVIQNVWGFWRRQC